MAKKPIKSSTAKVTKTRGTAGRPFNTSPAAGDAKKAPRAPSRFASAPKPGDAPKAPRAPKPSANPVGDFLKKADEARKLPVVQEKAPRTGNTNKAKPPKVINQGHVPGSPSRAVVPYKAAAKVTLKGAAVAVAKEGLKWAGRVGSVAAFPIGMVADAKPAGAGSDKPKGPLMKGNNFLKGSGSGKAGVSASGSGSLKVTPGAAKDTGRYVYGRPAGPDKSPATPVAAPSKKAVPAAPKPTARPSFSKGSSSPPAYTVPKAKPQVGGKVSSGFQGNWAGAAPSEMQKRGGARSNHGGGLFGKLKKK